ncbi:MAG: glycosyltransferase family 9 protein [Rubrivivax sp.]|nr:glycosyltransferase family 9 protein [Rubrivivax sp.]
MPSPNRPLIVRLRNWVGDVTLAVPMLQRLADQGYALQLVGKGWARDLLAGHGWPVHALPKAMSDRVALLRRLKAQAGAADPGFGGRMNALCLPDSFSSALEFRLAGLRALGHAYEGRSLLLARAHPRPRGMHELEVYWDLGSALLGVSAPVPATIGLRVSPAHEAQADALCRAHGIERECIVICPFAGGTWAKQDKTWPAFAEFAARELPAFGRSVVVCPGPGDEEAMAREHFPAARLLPGVNLGVYAALLQGAALMVANDTGPGHMAAALGTPLVSVLGPSDPALWRAWGPRVQLVRGAGTWPTVAAVAAAAAGALQTR